MKKVWHVLGVLVSLVVLFGGVALGYLFVNFGMEVINGTNSITAQYSNNIQAQFVASSNNYIFFGIGLALASVFVSFAVMYFSREIKHPEPRFDTAPPRKPKDEIVAHVGDLKEIPKEAPESIKVDADIKKDNNKNPKENTTIFSDEVVNGWEEKKNKLVAAQDKGKPAVTEVKK